MANVHRNHHGSCMHNSSASQPANQLRLSRKLN